MQTNSEISQAPKPKSKRPALPLNGVDTPTLFATINAVKASPELAAFQFRASNTWIQGTHSQTRIEGFYGASAERTRDEEFVYDADHPAVLVGGDKAPTPVEFLLHALASCLTAGIGNIAAARGITLESVNCKIEGDLNVLGLLGLSERVRNGFQRVRISFSIKGDASPETLQALLEQSKARSAVFDVLTNGIPVAVELAV